jgi:hypothetical protein
MKKGDKATMEFHYAGLVSTEEYIVTRSGKNYIEIDCELRGKNARFDPETGKCLNDITDLGAFRRLRVVSRAIAPTKDRHPDSEEETE